VEELKKQVEQLKTKMFYLQMSTLIIVVAFTTSQFLMTRDYSAIRSYYEDTQRQNVLLSETLEVVLLMLQELQTEMNESGR
jgi:hypothetical protein